MTKQDKQKKLTIKAIRIAGNKRIFSNYVEVNKSPWDVSLKFADVKPPANKEEMLSTIENGVIEIPIDAEIVMPSEIAQSLLEALKIQLENRKQ